jgi:hypothetical protein
MSLHAQLHDLLERVAVELRLLPGATELYLFGSLTTPQADAYADIDLQLVSADLALTRTNWPYLLEQIHPIELAWPITSAPDNTAFAVQFQGASYYHKIDIGLSAAVGDLPLPPDSTPAIQLWTQEPKCSTLPQPNSRAYIPTYGTVGHQLMEQLIAAVRYLKARKRGHQFTSWRFLRSQPDKLLHLLHAQMHGWMREERSLSTWDYKELDRVSDRGMQERIMRHLDWSTPRRMDQNFYWFLEQIVELNKEKALASSERIPEEIIGNHLAFIRRELGLQEDRAIT